MQGLLENKDFEKTHVFVEKVQISKDKEPVTDLKTTEDHISLRPQTAKMISDEKKFQFDFTVQHPIVEMQSSKMRELFNLCDTGFRYVYFSGIYPRINYLQDSPPEEIRYWYDFGAINSIHLTSPYFREISLLPQWIKDGVKNCFLNNPTISLKDIMVLKFLSAGPGFYKEDRYPAFHFMQVGKSESISISIPDVKNKKEFIKFDEKDIHYRRAIGIRVILQGMEANFKKGFRTYGGKSLYSSVMISFAKESPRAAKNYLEAKIKLLDKGTIKSSPQAQMRICQYRQHTKDTCHACTSQNNSDKGGTSSSSASFEDME